MNQPAVQFMLAPHLKNAMRSASRSQNNGVKSCNSTFFHAMHLAWRVPWDSNLPAVFTTAPRRAIAGPHANGYYAPARLPWAVCCSCQTGSPCGSSRCRILREIADCVGDSAVAAPASELWSMTATNVFKSSSNMQYRHDKYENYAFAEIPCPV
jgi:hypothetical protein